MKNLTLSLIAAVSVSTLTLAVPANAQTPPSVLQPYKAYNTAMQTKDYKTALREGKALALLNLLQRPPFGWSEKQNSSACLMPLAIIRRQRGEQALAIFNANPTLARPAFVVAAANAVGYSKEREGDFKAAAMAYQNSREVGETSLGRMHPLMRHTIGRWLNARERLDFNEDLAAAKASGMKEMWPYIQDSPKVKATKLGKADFGTSVINTQRLSGHVIFLTDIDDAGRPINIRVLDAQPGDAYVKMSKAALMKSVFPPKTAGEPTAFRKDVAVPYAYIVYDRNTQDTY